MGLNCSRCSLQSCKEEPGTARYPKFCPMAGGDEDALRVARDRYEDPETRRLAVASAQTESAGYCVWRRVQEIMDFAQRIDAQSLGIAHCVGLAQEARLLQAILEANGFEAHSICCKVGTIPKEDVGLQDADKIQPGTFEPLCNPVGQAEMLKQVGPS